MIFMAGSFIKQSKLMKTVFFGAVNAPVAGSVYRKFYRRHIGRQLAGFSYPQSMSIEPYNVCNLRCIMCPYKEMTRRKESMSMGLFKKIVDNAARIGVKTINLSFYNEPLIDPLLFERIDYVKSKGIKVMFYSNGTVINREKIDKILSNPPDVIIFSFDGATKDVYEKIRIGSRFERTKQNIINLINERNDRKLVLPFIQVNFTVQKDNRKEADIFRKFWGGLANNTDFGIVDNRESNDLIGDMDVKKPGNFKVNLTGVIPRP